MARKKHSKKKAGRIRPVRFLLRWVFRALMIVIVLLLLLILVYRYVPPPTTPYILSESRRLGGVERAWMSWDEIPPVMARSAVAAEDANFCEHWGFDMVAIRLALEEGANRGASTISQQVVKNTFLWHGRSWLRKALEGVLTPVVELIWPKRRILEMYLNVAEFDEGVFGISAAAQKYFGKDTAKLNFDEAARLAAVLPNPKGRDARNPSASLRKRAASIADGAATIANDGRTGDIDRTPRRRNRQFEGDGAVDPLGSGKGELSASLPQGDVAAPGASIT